MKDGRFPQATVGRASAYAFDLKVAGLVQPAMRFEWIDYPGGWWSGRELSDQREQAQKQECLLSLLDANVCFLLLDGAQFRDPQRRAAYLQRQLSIFDREIDFWQQTAQKRQRPPGDELKDWVIALTKADMMNQGFTAEDFSREVLLHGDEPLRKLTMRFTSNTGATPTKRFGTQFMILSSALGDGLHVRSAEQTIGLDLLIPAAFQAAFVRLAEQHKHDPESQNLPLWDRILLALQGAAGRGQLSQGVSPQNRGIALLAEFLIKLAGIGTQQRIRGHEEARKQAVAEGNALKALAYSLDQALSSEEARRVFYISQY